MGVFLKLLIVITVIAVALPGWAEESEGAAAAGVDSIPDFEGRLAEIDDRLAQLANFSLQTGVGTIGYWSRARVTSPHSEWVQIDFGDERVIDQIVLVPSIWRETSKGYTADAFPLEFRLVVMNEANPEGIEVASFGAKDQLLPRISPVVIPVPGGVAASKLRLEVTRLSPRIWDGRYNLQLSEILIFSGEENVALGGTVTTSDVQQVDSNSHSRGALVDGFLPYLMDAATGEQSLAAVGNQEGQKPAVIEIDLGSNQPLSWLHLHRTDLSDSVPQTVPSDFGIPERLLVEGASQDDFSDAEVLVDYRKNSVYDAGPIIARRFAETSCRYVRLTAVEPYSGDASGEGASQIGFAEIELFQPSGKNVAKGQPVKINFELVGRVRSLGAFTDGRNFHGDVISIREWMNQLAERHELERERPRVVAELGHRYEQQRLNLRRLEWLAIALSVGIVIVVLVYRIRQIREISRVRVRLAADLHDELGANLHTIGLLSDMAGDSRNTPDQLATLHRRIRSETERSGIAVRHCADTLEAGDLYTDLVGDMKRAARRILARTSHQFASSGDEFLLDLKPRERADLFLFYKECLVNASKHSGASEFVTELKADVKEVCLSVSDNGQGMPEGDEEQIPPSLLRRARLIGGHVSFESPKEGGTRVTLNLKNRRWRWRR